MELLEVNYKKPIKTGNLNVGDTVRIKCNNHFGVIIEAYHFKVKEGINYFKVKEGINYFKVKEGILTYWYHKSQMVKVD